MPPRGPLISSHLFCSLRLYQPRGRLAPLNQTLATRATPRPRRVKTGRRPSYEDKRCAVPEHRLGITNRANCAGASMFCAR